MLENLRRPVIRRDHDIGKRFVVAQHHIEARPQPLDEVGLEQQRLGLGAGDDEFERARRRDHALDAGVEPGRAGIGGDALFDVLRLADIEHVAARIDHAIDARPRRRELGVMDDRGAAGGERALLLVEAKLRRFRVIRLRQRLLVVLLDGLDLGRDPASAISADRDFLASDHSCCCKSATATGTTLQPPRLVKYRVS